MFEFQNLARKPLEKDEKFVVLTIKELIEQTKADFDWTLFLRSFYSVAPAVLVTNDTMIEIDDLESINELLSIYTLKDFNTE